MLIRVLGTFCLLAASALVHAQDLRSVLLDELKSTHDKKDWFVPIDVAVAGLTPEQASWTDGKGNHSVGQLTNHLLFWNTRALQKLTGEKPAAFSGNNDETFNKFDAKSWAETVSALDKVMVALENLVQNADETKLKSIAQVITLISTHNAYHVGEIVFVRKEQGSWDSAKGVK
jgi:hypothetical protein